MSEDASNSLYLWAGTLALFGAFWAALHFDFLDGVPATWGRWGLAVVVLFNVINTARGLWQRRASNPDNPNRN